MKIFCIGRNYTEHIKELNNEIPEDMVLFMKPNTALNSNKELWYKPDFSDEIHYECEIVLKICKNGKHIQPQFASNYFEELTVGIDFTARDIQTKLKEKGLPWEISKSFDNSAIIGAFINKDTLNVTNINFELTKNDSSVQKGESQYMIHSFEKIICYISQFFTLQKGDLIFTGTPAGVSKVSRGDVYRGFIEKNELFFFEVK